jgi:hypothetical protein
MRKYRSQQSQEWQHGVRVAAEACVAREGRNGRQDAPGAGPKNRSEENVGGATAGEVGMLLKLLWWTFVEGMSKSDCRETTMSSGRWGIPGSVQCGRRWCDAERYMWLVS